MSLLGVENASEFREAILEQKDNLTANTPAKSSNEETPQSQVELIRTLTYSVKNIENMLVTLLDEKK